MKRARELTSNSTNQVDTPTSLDELTNITNTFDRQLADQAVSPEMLVHLSERINQYQQEHCNSMSIIRLFQAFLNDKPNPLANQHLKYNHLLRCQKIVRSYTNWCWQTRQHQNITAAAEALNRQLFNYTCTLNGNIAFIEHYAGNIHNKDNLRDFINNLSILVTNDDVISHAIRDDQKNVLVEYLDLVQHCVATQDSFMDFIFSQPRSNDIALYFNDVLAPLPDIAQQLNDAAEAANAPTDQLAERRPRL